MTVWTKCDVLLWTGCDLIDCRFGCGLNVTVWTGGLDVVWIKLDGMD